MIFKTKKALKEFLDQQAEKYESLDFIKEDPILIPHRFSKKEDIEIIGFLVSTIAWGNRKSIINSGNRLCEIMENSPHDFILNHTEQDIKNIDKFVHRTFNIEDLRHFFLALQCIYRNNTSLESIFTEGFSRQKDSAHAISNFKKKFFEIDHLKRTQKHVSDPLKGSSAKRINMYLRWMARSADKGVDFGLWKNIPNAKLMMPLDVHTGNVGRELGLLTRKQNDWKSVLELTENLRKFDSEDPVKYDFALFGMGVQKIKF
jgi:uncharacterized protein (TIGR02757 family)